jgi:hypothetical protein
MQPRIDGVALYTTPRAGMSPEEQEEIAQWLAEAGFDVDAYDYVSAEEFCIFAPREVVEKE